MIVVEPGREQEASVRLGRIGFDNVAGFLAGGMLALADRPELVERIDRITAAALAEQLAGPDPPLVLDVRAASERDGLCVPGSLNIPLGRLPAELDGLPRPADRRPLLVGLPLLDRREHPAPKRVRRGLRPRRRAQRSASAISLRRVFQLRAVPATPRRRSK